HVPRRHLEGDVVGERLVPGQGVAPPGGPRGVGADVVARAEAPPLRAEHHDAGRGVAVGLAEALDELVLQVEADGVELVGPVERDDADVAVDGVAHERGGHGGAPRGWGWSGQTVTSHRPTSRLLTRWAVAWREARRGGGGPGSGRG